MACESSPAAAPRKAPAWKRLLLITASVGGGLVAVVAVWALGTHWYYFHPRPTREWPERDIEAYGVKVSLKTRWRDDELYYRLELSPLRPDQIDAFDRSLRASPEGLRLTLLLYDDSGFQVCAASIDRPDIKRDVDKNGKIASLSVNSTWPFCSLARYKDSAKWNLSWHGLPKTLSEGSENGPAKLPTAPTGRPRHDKAESAQGTDTISGVDDVNSRIDTESGRTFAVRRSGEQYTIISWGAKQRLRFSCASETDCVVTNTDKEETVHAWLAK